MSLDFEKICSADEQNLRKAEVLIYSKGTSYISNITGIHLPESSAITVLHNMSDNNNKDLKKRAMSYNLNKFLII